MILKMGKAQLLQVYRLPLYMSVSLLIDYIFKGLFKGCLCGSVG